MTSYLRSIFGGGYPNQPMPIPGTTHSTSSSHRSKSHSRSNSVPTVQTINPSSAAYIYATTGSTTSTSSRTASRPTSKRSQSFSRATPPSPLRYDTYDSGASYAASDDGKHSRSRSRSALPYRRASYKTSDPGMCNISMIYLHVV